MANHLMPSTKRASGQSAITRKESKSSRPHPRRQVIRGCNSVQNSRCHKPVLHAAPTSHKVKDGYRYNMVILRTFGYREHITKIPACTTDIFFGSVGWRKSEPYHSPR